MRIEILGSGCYKCLRLEQHVHEVLHELQAPPVEVVRITDERAIRRRMPPDETPGLVVDGALVSVGELPTRDMLAAWLRGIAAEAM